jgi:hypothetical protein
MKYHGVDEIYSYDRDFDAIEGVKRVTVTKLNCEGVEELGQLTQTLFTDTDD